MEEEPKKEKSGGKTMHVFVTVLVVFMISWGFYYGFNAYKEKCRESEENKKAYNDMFLKFQQGAAYSDSLYKVNMRFNKYRHAAESQAYRDSVSRGMDYKPGDFAYKKSDSSKVVVSDIIVGGGLYNYYFRYRIIDKSGAEQEIKPELLFSRKQSK